MQCASCGFADSSVTPADAVVALRSYPRRFKAALAMPDEDDRADDVLHRPASDGWSAVDHAVHLAAALRAVAEALRLVSMGSGRMVALEPERRADSPLTVDGVVADLRAAAEAAAEAVGRIEGKDWERTAPVNGEEELTALDLARHGVHEGVHHLRAAERAVSEAVSNR